MSTQLSNELLGRINEQYENMSKGQKKLASYITDNYDNTGEFDESVKQFIKSFDMYFPI